MEVRVLSCGLSTFNLTYSEVQDTARGTLSVVYSQRRSKQIVCHGRRQEMGDGPPAGMYALVAQLEEQVAFNCLAVGSSPTGRSESTTLATWKCADKKA